MSVRAMVLAAGVGSRLDPLTTQLPKPLVPVMNRPVMEHILLLLKKHGITEVVSNLHYKADEVFDYFQDGSKLGMSLKFLREHTLSGDAGGVRACRDFLEEDTFIVIMGDLLTDADITSVLAQHKEKKALATIALKEVPDVSHFGVALLNSEGFITGFQEKPKKEEALSNLASTGIYVLEPEIFKHIPNTGEYGFGRQLFPRLVQEGFPVLGARIKDYWSDVGTIAQYCLSNFHALDGLVELEFPGMKTDFGYAFDDSHINLDIHIEGHLAIGHNTTIGRGVKIRGSVIIGDNCIIEDGVELSDTIVWSDSIIGGQAKVSGSVLGIGSKIETGSTHVQTVMAACLNRNEPPLVASLAKFR